MSSPTVSLPRHLPTLLFMGAFASVMGLLCGFPAEADAREQEPPLAGSSSSERPSPTGPAFNGSFLEYGARAGLSRSRQGATSGWALDAGVRHSFPLYLLDTRLAYRLDRLSGDQTDVTVHGSALTLGLHPFYLALLSRGWVSHFLASLHLELGVGLQAGSRRRESLTGTDSENGWGVSWSLGTGFDLPLGDANRGSAPWLNVVYRYGGTSLSILDDLDGARRSHALFAGVGWRINGPAF
jgi:hypothetical protein